MVNLLVSAALLQQEQPVIQRLDPATRAKVLAALLALVILGLVLMTLAWVGARLARRYASWEPTRRAPSIPDPDDWARKPLVPSDGSRRSTEETPDEREPS